VFFLLSILYWPGLLILQKYFPLKAHISLRMTATASKPVWHSSGGSLLDTSGGEFLGASQQYGFFVKAQIAE
jgi:hypothetical protein